MKASILTIGDELLIGQVVDSNSAWMATQLNLYGVEVVEILTVSDTKPSIESGLDRCLSHSDLVLMTGGLGPTKDDITKKILADYCGLRMYFHQPTHDRILQIFERYQREPTEAHRLQCYMPEKAIILDNKVGTAPGMWIKKDEKVIVSMPGVPYEMKYLVENEVLPLIKKEFNTPFIQHRTILTVGDGESRIAKKIEHIEQNLPDFIKLAYLPGLGQVRLRLSASGTDETMIGACLDKEVESIKATIPELIYGYDTDELEAVVGRMLLESNLTLGTAESCTGGAIAHRITAIPGASAYFRGSIIAYSNEIKKQLLHVQSSTLENHGAVSEATVKEMVEGALDTLNVDVAVAVSGIAGPGGGTPEKPVGTIWMAVGDEHTISTRKLQLGKDRKRNIVYTATQALNLVRQFLYKRKLVATTE